jgi:sugar phosphate isomerase/epimerase
MAPAWDLAQCVAGWRRAGLAAIGVTIDRVEALGVSRAVEVLLSSGLKVANLQGIDPFDVVHPERFDERLSRTLPYLDLASTLNADCVYACSGARGGLDWEVAADRLVAQVATLLPHLQERGVRLALEPIHPIRQDLSFVNLATDVEDILARVPDPSVGYVYDFWHLWWQRDAMAVARRTATRVVSVQPSDHKPVTLRTLDRAVPGQGIAPVGALLAALEGGGYSGFYDLEVLSPDNDEKGYDRALEETITGFAEAAGGLDERTSEQTHGHRRSGLTGHTCGPR